MFGNILIFSKFIILQLLLNVGFVFAEFLQLRLHDRRHQCAVFVYILDVCTAVHCSQRLRRDFPP
jgi:hypothetical protein